MDDDNFPRGQATIYFRIKKEDEDIDTFFSRIFFRLPPLPLFNKITLYHTPENKDTWKPDHIPREISRTKTSSFAVYKNRGVLILGKDSLGEYLLELLKIKKFLVMKGYKKATLLKPIKDLSNQSLEQKVRLWGLLTRFTIIVDRVPAGHLNEFEMLKRQDTIIAVLRPRGFKSTSMMESHPKSELIKTFEFKETPLERIDDVIKWAEKITKENEIYYNKEYDWRKDYYDY